MILYDIKGYYDIYIYIYMILFYIYIYDIVLYMCVILYDVTILHYYI